MKASLLILIILILISRLTFSQIYPTFGTEKPVTITGLTFDAMEPFISLDAQTLFFNSLNSGGNTNLYYATRINDTTFTYVGNVNGTYDPSLDHLDAVASKDSANNFFWASLRKIPNLHRGKYLTGNVSNVSQVYGTCNIFSPGWIIIDAAINYQGNLLYYSNGYFGPTYSECVGVPCEAKLGIAQKVNDSTFNKTIYSDAILSNVNDPNYLVYAPQVTKDGLELYYSRLLKDSYNTEICVSVRNTISEAFSLPMVIYSSYGYFPEAATPTTDKQIIYYHKKNEAFIYNIYLRYRTGTTGTTGIKEQTNHGNIKVFPNPTNHIFHIVLPDPSAHFTITVYSSIGQVVFTESDHTSIDISNIAKGIYFLTVNQNDKNWSTKIIKE